MPTTYRATLTNVGAALVADAIASGTTLTWAKMALGDGNGSAVIVDAGRTSLVNEQYRAPLNDLGRDSANPNTIVGTLVVPPETGGWTIREFGIYDNAATPRLVAYGETPEIEKPASSAGTGINLRLRFKLIVSADANITLAPDSNEAYATIEYVKDNAVKSLSVSGRTITYTMGDGDTHTITTQDTTYNDATQSVHGLMSAEDKTTLDNVPTTYVKKVGDTVSGAILSIVGSASVDGSRNRQFGGSMGNNDMWSISVGATANDAGFLEISTGNNGNEPIYVAQNNTSAGTSRRAALLDGSGNTSFPGTVTVGGLKIGTSTIGSATKPVFVKDGSITAGTYELNKTVPANAVFTDTTYNNFVKSGSTAKNGLVPAPPTTAGTTKYLREDGTWQVPTTAVNGALFAISKNSVWQTGSIQTAGRITNSSKRIYFTLTPVHIPPVVNNSAIKSVSINGLTVYSANGGTQDVKSLISTVTAGLRNSGIVFEVNLSSACSALNNAPVGLNVDATVTFT